jgi:hypothetical protein
MDYRAGKSSRLSCHAFRSNQVGLSDTAFVREHGAAHRGTAGAELLGKGLGMKEQLKRGRLGLYWKAAKS